MLKIGDTAPGFTLRTPDDRSVTLRDALHDQRVLLLIFLRHLG